MKTLYNCNRFIFALMLALFVTAVTAQAPQGINYQAIARAADGLAH